MKISLIQKIVSTLVIILLVLTQVDLVFNSVNAASPISIDATGKKILLWSKGPNPQGNTMRKVFANGAVDVYKQIYNSQVTVDDLTNISAALPNLDEYSLVFIILPTTMPDNTEIQNLKQYVARGGRIVLIGEHNQIAANENTILSNIAAKLGAHFEIKDGVYGRI